MIRRYAILAVVGLGLGVAASLGAGCEPKNKLDVVVEEGAAAVRANLPSVPTLPPPPHPVRLPDNSYTVYGLRHEAARNWTKQVTVRGHIVDVYVPMVPGSRPPRPCRPNECEEERPHIYIADTPTETDPERRLQVTGYANFQAEIDEARVAAARQRPAQNAQPNALQQQGLTRSIPTDFYPGAEVSITGTFTRRASNGQADSNGLIEYASHRTITPAPDAGAPRR